MSNPITLYYFSLGTTSVLPDVNSNKTNLKTALSSRLISPLVPNFAFVFNVVLETTLTEGNLVYVFHPFRNMIKDKEIVDFSTKDLNFSLNYPIDIEIQPSYDGTVNLILTDNLNPPRLINSRFSATEGKRYYVVDRFGTKDTNLYNYEKMDSQTKLYKTINKIPKLDFIGLNNDGKLAVGNYVFYFRLVDVDDNETDIITESGIVSCHVGGINDPLSIRGGIGNENSGKSISFKFTDLDSNYNFLNIYYSRSTSDYNGQELTSYRKIATKFTIKGDVFEFRITGYEPIEAITRDKINLQYNIIDRNKSAAQTQNRLFLANIHKTTLPFLELKDLSCRILPKPNQIAGLNIGFLNTDYSSRTLGECAYYNASNIYNYTGYWDEEIYRLAIVYIMTDFSLSDPYNIRGCDFNKKETLKAEYSMPPLYKNSSRNLISAEDEDGFLTMQDNKDFLENIKGVIKIRSASAQILEKQIKPISINLSISAEVQAELIKYTRGFFIVRQKRIPTIISQGFSIGCDKISGLPLIPEYDGATTNHVIQSSTIYQPGYANTIIDNLAYSSIQKSLTAALGKYRLPNKGEVYFTFISDKNMADVTQLLPRLHKGGGMLVPDLSLDMSTLSQIFSGSEFTITSTRFAPLNKGFTRFTKGLFISNKTLDEIDQASTHFVINDYITNSNIKSEKMTLLCVQDDTVSISYNNNYYSTRAGIPEEPWRFSAFLKEEIGLVKSNYSHNGVPYTYGQNALIRGSFMPFLGMSKKTTSTTDSAEFYNIRTLGYSENNTKTLFITRGNDNAPFMAISDRYSWNNFNIAMDPITRSIDIFRGDCFINQTTIRVLRNFQDPELPANDIIVNYNTLEENFKGYISDSSTSNVLELTESKIANKTAGTGIYGIIRSDVNANRLGYWVTLKFCSNINYAFRCTDPTFTSEQAIFGKPRGFYPLFDKSLAGNSKIAESTVMNVGYNSTTSDKELFITPDVQSIKNDFTNRIMFSEVHVNDATKNGFRIFEGLDYKDYTIEYGTITKIVTWKSNLIVIFENGIGMVPINERTMAGQAEGENIYTRGAGVLAEKPFMISQKVGSTWKDSIRTSQNYIYGVDTTAKKIWRTDGEKFEIFSEFKIQKFLNDNLTFTVYDRTPAIGLKNVVTHFNNHKHDVMFTFYDQTFNEEEKVWNLCFNEQLNNWTTRYSWVPAFSENIDNTMFTFSRGTCKVTSMISKSISTADGIGSIYLDSGINIDTPAEKYLTTKDYLSLFYEKRAEDNYSLYPNSSYALTIIDDIVNIPSANSIEFLDSPGAGFHPMGSTAGYDKVCVFAPPVDQMLWIYSPYNERISLSSNSYLAFYSSKNSNISLVGDTLLRKLHDGDFINNSGYTSSTEPYLKIQFYVTPPILTDPTILAGTGWDFNIKSIPFDINLLDTTEYLLTLQGKEKYKHPTFIYEKLEDKGPIYDNEIFMINNYKSILSIKSNAFKDINAEIKYAKLLKILGRIYFSLLLDLKVYFNIDKTNVSNLDKTNTLSAYDTFRDVIYLRPNLDTIDELIKIFSPGGTVPVLKPSTSNTPEVLLTAFQCNEILELLIKTKTRYLANTTTNLWKHGSSGIFGNETEALPAVWYDDNTHKFEFEFVVNGEELGIHKLFDNLKIISNKAEPESFEFEILGDAYEFTKDNKLYDLAKSDSSLLEPGYTLLEPARESFNNKTKEKGIVVVQEAKNIANKFYGLRKGNLQYKEDMWEVQISSLKVEYVNKSNIRKVIETKIRDKYCRIRIKYAGSQMAIITALQTIYTLSYS